MGSWDDFINYLEQHWDKSKPEVCEQLIPTIRYAVFTPLDGVKTLSDLLANQAKSSQIQSWARDCHHNCQNWINKYWEIQQSCLNNSEDKEKCCKCILQGIQGLFTDGMDVLSPEKKLFVLIEEEFSGLGKTLFDKLASIVRIHDQLHTQNLFWLQEYINEQDTLRGK